jgi:hypothetical protein
LTTNNASSLFIRLLFLITGLIFYVAVSAQVDPMKRDSLARSIEREKEAIQAYQDSFTKVQDSLVNSRQPEINRTSNTIPEDHNDSDNEFRGNAVLLPVALAIVLLIFLIWKRRQN